MRQLKIDEFYAFNKLALSISLRAPTRDKAATLGTLMQQAGYRTAAIGKWHLGLRSGQWKYIPTLRRQPEGLFNLATDPAEKHNLAPTQPGKAAELHARLRELTRESKH